MKLSVTNRLKLSYIIVILIQVTPLNLIKQGFGAFAIGNGGLLMPYVGAGFFFIVGLYRVAMVIRNPCSLGSYEVGGFVSTLRKIGIFSLYVGAVIGILSLTLDLIVPELMGLVNGQGIGFFMTLKIVLVYFGVFQLIGITAFELSRLLAMENHMRI